MSIDTFLDQNQKSLQVEQNKALDAWAKYAIDSKSYVLKFIEKYFPKFYLACQRELIESSPVFVCVDFNEQKEAFSLFGDPGVLVEGMIFAVHKGIRVCDSALVIGKYRGIEPFIKYGEIYIGEARGDLDLRLAGVLHTHLRKKK